MTKTLNTNNITIKNIGTDKVAFRYFNVNFSETLEVGDSVILTPASAEAKAYYIALADSVKGIEVTDLLLDQENAE